MRRRSDLLFSATAGQTNVRVAAFFLIGGLVCLGGLAGSGWTTGADTTAAALPADLAAVPGHGVVFFRVNVSTLLHDPDFKPVWERVRKENAEQIERGEKELGMPLAEVDRVIGVMFRMSKMPGDQPFVFLVTTRGRTDRTSVLAGMLGEPKEEALGERTLYTGKEKRAICFIGDRTFITGPDRTVREFVESLGSDRDGPLAPAVRAADDSHVVSAGVNPKPLFEQAPEDLPDQAKPFEALRKTKLITVTFDVDKDTRLSSQLTFKTETDAKAGEKALKSAHLIGTIALGQLLGGAKKSTTPEQFELLRVLNTAFQKTTIKANETEVDIKFVAPIDRAKAVAAIGKGMDTARGAADRTRNQNNLKQIALALHQYHDVNGRFPPPAVLAKDGTPLLSWRVLILPYIEEGALAKQFKMDEAWDSDDNKKLLARIPAVFAAKSSTPQAPFLTNYRVFTGPDTAFPEKGRKIADITDGTSNTLLVVEAADGVPWTKPEELPYSKDQPLPKLGCLEPGRYSVAFADGAVRTFTDKVAEATVRAFITADAGDRPGETE